MEIGDAFCTWAGWKIAGPLTVLSVAVPMVVARFFGPHRSWEPFRESAVFFLGYLLAMASFTTTALLLEGAVGGCWFGLFGLFSSLFVTLGLPLLALTVLGVHLRVSQSARQIYVIAVLLELGLGIAFIVFNLEDPPAAGVEFSAIEDIRWLLSQVAVGLALMLIALRGRATADFHSSST